MSRLHLFLLLVVIVSALSVVTSQHKARKTFVELQQAQAKQRELDVEWGQLQLEQSTWAMHARVEKLATEKLQMQLPDAAHVQVVFAGKSRDGSQ
ncbi:cell division protein FtsL [Sulfuriferula nivalis]|uniref:Cell division protein FtsL n=1 Tax=Sulfuriferula nivalis TaxID=2675298 RepID=A0A809RME1_9PROT|nr:cell division protein FtsL [Sulfuriferula nivalis]BBP01964.1 cell division protein FtsL [Sulfuriferula nivalis]